MRFLRVVVALAALGLLAPACAYSASYYVSLGDSLAAGVQPDADGVPQSTKQGYTDATFRSLRGRIRGIRVVKLGCPGETTQTFLDGGRCAYAGGAVRGPSQLAAAKRFLKANRGQVRFATLSIGASDVQVCARDSSLDLDCVRAGLARARKNLPRIGRELRSAAGKGVRIAVLQVYDPFLAFHLRGSDYRGLADLSVGHAAALNRSIGSMARKNAFRTADAFKALKTTDTTPATVNGVGVPASVEAICRYTYMCRSAPRGPDLHLNAAGYRLVAGLFRTALAF